MEITGTHTANRTCDCQLRWRSDVTDHPPSLCADLYSFISICPYPIRMTWLASDLQQCQHEASCRWLAARAEHHLFSGRCLNVSYDCVEVWCVPSAMCKYSAWHHSVIKCFATSLHIFMSPYSAFHGLGISWLCLHISFLTLRRLMSYIYIYIYIWSTHSWCF